MKLLLGDSLPLSFIVSCTFPYWMLISARRAALGVGISNIVNPGKAISIVYTSFGVAEGRDPELYWFIGVRWSAPFKEIIKQSTSLRISLLCGR